jgi:hypothetical protein
MGSGPEVKRTSLKEEVQNVGERCCASVAFTYLYIYRNNSHHRNERHRSACVRSPQAKNLNFNLKLN